MMNAQALVTHPFDREEEVSLEQLFTSFCNHLSLGQWELTRVCLRGLFEKRNQLNKPLKEILRAIIDQPHHASCGSKSVSSPFYLSWLCLVEYLDLFVNEEDQIPEQVVKKVEFRLLLYLACQNAPQNVIQDIDDYHSQIVYRDPDLFASGVSDLPSSTLSYLKQLLSDNPQFGRAVINDLTSKGKGFLKNNQLLQQLYLDLINEQLKVLDGDFIEPPLLGRERNTQDSTAKQCAEFIYQMLSYINASPDMISLNKKLDELFHNLIYQTFEDPNYLDKGTLYSCLLSHPSFYLIEKYCRIENQMRFSVEGLPKVPLQSRFAMQGFKQHSISVGYFVQICYAQSFIKNRQDAWQYLFFHALEGNHVLENVVETALLFVKEGDFEQLTQLLSPAEFSRLKPLVLLLGWPYCYSCENARNLLEALWNPAERGAHPLLYQACQKLAYQVQLVQWCTDKARPLLASSESGSTRHQQASEMFQGLESHSVLHVLHKSVSLAYLPENDVFELLMKRPVFTPMESGKELLGVEDKASEIKQTGNDGLLETFPEKRQRSQFHPEVQRDIFIFHSYCALKNFMEVMTSSLEQNPSKGFDESLESSRSDSSGGVECARQEKTYRTQVENKLEAGRAHLAHVYPLTYRVEILENIFSLLFGTFEDLYEGRTQQSESDDFDTVDEETRSLSTSNRTGSWESIASSVDLSVDLHGPLSPVKDQEKLTSPFSLPATSDSQLKQKETSAPPGVESSSRRQLFAHKRSDSDSTLLKKLKGSVGEEKLTETAVSRDDTVKTKHSENAPFSGNVLSSKESSRTAVSDENDLKCEFVIDDGVVCDVLNSLKECLMELNAAKFAELKKEKSDERSKSEEWLQTSVPRSSMEQRISRLGQFINEAQWRFQLVSWDNGTNRQKTRSSRKRLSRKLQHVADSDESWKADAAQDEDSDVALIEGANGKSKSRRKGAGSKENSGESSSHLSQDTVTTEAEECKERVKKRRMKRRRLTSRNSAAEISNLLTKDGSVIARMLSSPDTLIYMCMRKDNFERAHQVIKMFNMTEKPSAQAAVFAEKYSKSVKHLESLQPKARRLMTMQVLSKSRKPIGVLGAVAMAAASGSHTSQISTLIDDLLTTPSLAAVVNPSLSSEDLGSGNSTLVYYLSPQMVPTMLCLDMASTAEVSWSVCKTLLEMAKSRLTEDTSSSPTKSNAPFPGVIRFMNQLDELLNQEQSRLTFSMKPKANSLEVLLVGTHPLSPKVREVHKKLLAYQEEASRRLEQALDQSDTQIETQSVEEVSQNAHAQRNVSGKASVDPLERSLSVRKGMSEMQKAFDCVESASYVTTAVGGGLEERSDYMSSLFKHVDTLASLLLVWKTKSVDSASSVPPEVDMNRPSPKAHNPFVVLNEGIAESLGVPMFKRNIPPKDLETVAKNLHVNLSKVIVFNCCPAVKSRGGISDRDVRWPSSDPVILNSGSRWTDTVRHPNTVAKDLLSRMMKMLEDVGEAHGGQVDVKSAANAVRTPQFQAIVRGTAELQNVNLDLLNSEAAKVAFYVNTLNLLIAHASLVQFADTSMDDLSDVTSPITRHGSFTRLVDAVSSSSGGGSKSEEPVPLTSLERIAFLKQNCYFIGQLGLVSAFDLQFVILHKGLVPPSTFGEGVIMCFPERTTDEVKRKYRLTTAEKRIIFSICDGCESSPDLQVFDVEELEEQLSTAVVSYINSRVVLNQETGQITLPEILHWYRKDFEIRSFDTIDSPAGHDVSLLLQMEPYLYPAASKTLQQMLPNITEITFTPFCWTFCYKFESATLERSSSSSVFLRSNSVPDSLCLSMELSVIARTGRPEKRDLFSLNDATTEYLEEKSPLVAALARLVCSAPRKSQDNAESNSLTTNTTFESKNVDSTGESIEFPLQVALENTAKFPFLQRYLACKLYTIADMLTLAPVDSEEFGSSCGSYDIIKLDSNMQYLQEGTRAPEISLFSVALASQGSWPMQKAILKASDFFLRRGYFEDLLELISSSDLRGDGIGGPGIDFLLSSAILSKGGTRSNVREKLGLVIKELEIPDLKFSHSVHKKPWTLLARMKDQSHLAQLVLGKLSEWSAKTCIDLIELCLSRPLKNTNLREDLERKKREIILHQKISQCAKSSQFLVTSKDQDETSQSNLKHWEGVADATEGEPNVVMDFLLSVQQFDLAAEWAELHVLPKHFHLNIKKSQLKQLLAHSPDDHMRAYRILEDLQDHEMALAICNSLLSQNLHVGQTLFILQFMLTNLSSLLSPVRVQTLLCTKMGAKALLCLPVSARPNYEHLVSRPPLLLEQLLMNMKVDWAAKVFQRIQVDLSCMEDLESLGDHGCTVKAFDELLATYSAKALEFQIVQLERSQTRELCSSIMQSLIQTPSSSPTPSTSMGGRMTPLPETGRHTPLTSTAMKERGARDSPAGSLERKSQTVLRRGISTESRTSALDKERKTQRQSSSPLTTGTLGRKTSQVIAGQGRQQQMYIPPVAPPTKANWMPDQQVSMCVICREVFSMFNRRHHCRRCGRVVCGTCSQHNHVVTGYGQDPVRVCDTCYEYCYSSRSLPFRHDHSSPVRSEPVSLDKDRSQDYPDSSVNESAFGSDLGGTSSTEWLTEDMNARCLWKLGLDEANNSSLREEFFYEQAPSAPLCVSILDLHSDTKACGRLILDLCNSLSQKLVPVAPGVRNEELDHNLVISMIRYLLFNAKLKMLKTGETQGVELDTYLGHLDLMKFLVESNCGDIPSLRDLMDPDSARRLRDRLIEAERLTLAMEVSTKCGLDPSGVWGAAAFSLLQAGDFLGAREKFSRCMKPEEGGKQHQQHNSQYLGKIIDILQSSPMLANKMSTDDLLKFSPLDLWEKSPNFHGGNSSLDPKRFDECLYYLHKYGSPSSLVAFYVRHGHVRFACRYILDQQCPAEVFIESLFMRLVFKGSWTQLKEQMETADPTLQSWMPYLTATCKFLLRRSFHHLLYDVQVFMRDLFRAAQTCIRFYEGVAGGPVTSYEDLYSRLHHLEKAKHHIETVIAEKKSPKGTVNTVFAYLRQRSTASAKSTTEEPSHVTMSLSELNSHVNAINLQTEVTNFLHKCAVERGGMGLLRANDGNRLPTLFGNGHVRGELAVQVLLAGSSIQDGFSLASRIIQDYNLPAARVYVDVGRSLARQYKFSHIEELLNCSGETGQVSDKYHDDIILACVSIVSADQSQAKNLEGLVKLLKSETNKINAFVMCGKLKSAYLIAVKGDRVEAIREIADVALNSGQSKMVEICNKYLNQNARRREAQERKEALQRKQSQQ